MIKGTRIFKVTVANGKIDPKPFNKYDDWKDAIENNTFVSDESVYQEKAKANYRWTLLSMNLNKGLETLSNIKAEATSSTIPNSVEFVLTYTQPDALWFREEDGTVVSEDKKEVITKIIEDTLNQDYKVLLEWFDPTVMVSENDLIYSSPMPYGVATSELEVEAQQPSVTFSEDFDLEYKQFEE